MTVSTNDETSLVGLPTVIFTGCVTAVLLSALFVVQRESKKRKSISQTIVTEERNESKTLIDKTKFPGGQITIYYATQTGTAESFAQQLEREGADHGFSIRVVDMEDVKVEDLLKATAFGDNDDKKKEARAIILAATYGEGEPTDNSNEMVQILKEKMLDDPPPILLNGLEFCVFGLGNRQYEHYNAMGKFFDEALVKLGAERVIPLGLGDDDADLEADFESWKETMWAALKKKYCNEAVIAKSSTTELPACEYTIQYHSQVAKPNFKVPLDHIHGSGRVYFTAVDCPVVTNKELRAPEDGGSTKHIEIDISHAPGFHYTTADNLGVLPLNDSKMVESVAAALGYDLDAVFSLQASPGHEWHGDPFPMPLSVRECLTRYLDLTSAPRRSDLKLLTQYATDKVDRQALLRLSSKEGKQEYKEKIMQSYVGMADLLRLCPSLRIPLEHFISLCHFLVPRYYTIASSSIVRPQTIHLTVAVTQEKRKDGTLFEGVCSTHLALRSPLDTVRVMVRPSTFRLPANSSRPIIMIGPGTGIAPMRAFLQERFHQAQHGQKVGSNILYFGCKRKDLDFLYQEELQAWQGQGLQLHIAFSRETTNKVYVQHLLQQNAKETWDYIDSQHASIYVCGGVKMGHDVTETLKEILVHQGEMSFDKAKDYLAKLASEGRFVQELWA